MILLSPPNQLPSSSSSTHPPNTRVPSSHPTSVSLKMSIFYQNLNRIRSKLVELRSNIPLESYDAFALTETNLTSSFFNGELGFCDSTVFRCDRSSLTSSRSSGGGVLLAVNSRFSCSQVSLNDVSVEQIFVRVSYGPRSKHCIIGVVYIPPDAPLQYYQTHWEVVDYVRNLYPSDELVMLGDYNLPDSSWGDPSNYYLPSGTSEKSSLSIEQASFLHLKQFNGVLNSMGRTLDLVFSTLPPYECCVVQTEPLLEAEPIHPPLLFTFTFPSFIACVKPDDEVVFNFKKCDYTLINNIFNSFDWDFFLNENNVETNVLRLNTFLHDIIKCFVPSYIRKHDSFPLWFSPPLKRLILQKKLVHNIFKSSGYPEHYHEFSRLRALCKLLSNDCYSNYLISVESAIRQDPRFFWKYERSMRTDQGIPKNLRYGSREINTILEASNLFAHHFSSAYSEIPTCSPDFTFSSSDVLSSCSISEADIRFSLFKLNPHKGAGPDGVPPHFLKQCFFSLSYPLYIVFNQSLASGVFPESWKHSFIKPIPKKNLSKSDICNYRPISILSTIPKLFESLLLDKFLPFILPTIIVNQHGFVPRNSVSSNLLSYTNFIMNQFQNRSQVDSLYLDLTKAFDRVNHRILLDKLFSNGVTGSLLNWFSSYLSNRYSSVRIGSSTSCSFVTSSGVPQGSHLGPILFLVFINDVHTVLSQFDVQYLLFCDDFKLFKAINSSDDQIHLQSALTALYEWFNFNCLSVNPSKCHVISFSWTVPNLYSYAIESVSIPRTDCVRDLGVLFDVKLTFNPHIDMIRSKASRMLGFIFRSTKDFSSVLPLKILYCSLVRGVLEFASPVWNPYYDIHSSSLERIQHRALRFMSRKFQLGFNSYFEVESHLSLLPLAKRRTLYDFITFFKILHSHINVPDLLGEINIHAPDRILRNPLPFRPPHARTNYLYNSPIYRFQRLSNEHSNEIDIYFTSIPEIKSFFLHQYFDEVP